LNAKLQTVLARIGSFLVSIFGLGMSVAGIFSCDPGCALPVTQDASIHNLVSPIIFLSIIVGTIILGLSFGRDPQWKPLWIYSVATGIIAMIFMFVMINSFEARTYTGMWQRLFLLTAFVWMCIVGLRLRSTAGGTLESQAD
jgi:hypothetical protein